MKFVNWIMLAFSCVLLGIVVVQFMVSSPQVMSIYLVLIVLLLIGIFLLMYRFMRGWNILSGTLLILVGFVAGYLIMNSIFLGQEEHRTLPPIVRGIDDPGDGHTAVVYFTHGEPAAYSPMPWIETFQELDADKASFIPIPFRPFFLMNLRNYYLVSGGSPHNKIHEIMIRSLEGYFLQKNVDKEMRFYLSFLDNNPRPDEMVIRAINEGATNIILVPVFLTESSHTQAGREMVEALGLDSYNISLYHSQPLWDEEPLQQMYVARADKLIRDFDKKKVGILLVGHGQPEDWDKLYPTQTEQEQSFREKVRDRFIEVGYTPENVSLAWMEFKQPTVVEKAIEMSQNGIEILLVIPAAISADSIHNDIQIPEEIEEAHLSEEIQVIHMGAWGNDPYLIEAIYNKIQEINPMITP
jgi:protoheme ferro-lyase